MARRLVLIAEDVNTVPGRYTEGEFCKTVHNEVLKQDETDSIIIHLTTNFFWSGRKLSKPTTLTTVKSGDIKR